MKSDFCKGRWHSGCNGCGCFCHKAPKQPAVIESMTKIKQAGHTIRVWRAEKQIQFVYDNTDLFEAAAPWSSIDFIARALIEVPRVNAVEVIRDEDGAGMVVYPEWP